ncbi:MAG: AAA family ATPase [Gammaproteobacteria bacterium]|nr:AAA family ATPase [Gammaproteobacteria bacterium]
MKIYNLYDEVEDYKLEWLVDELIPYSEPTIIYGAMSSGKTALALHLGFCIADGRDFFDHPVRKSSVLFIALEGQRDIEPRSLAHWKKHGRKERSNFWIIHEGFKFGDNNSKNTLYRLISEYDIEVIIIDTLSLARPSGTLNDDGSASIVTRELRDYASYGVSVILIGHSGKDQRRGLANSQVLQNDVPTILKAAKNPKDQIGKLSVIKQRSGITGKTLNYKIEPIEINDEGQTAICIVNSEGEKEPHDIKVFNAISDLVEESNNGITRKVIQNYIGSLDPEESKKEKISKSLLSMINRSIKNLINKNQIIKVETHLETLFKLPDSTRKQGETHGTK